MNADKNLLKLSDFGLSIRLEPPGKKLKTSGLNGVFGTRCYMAPEMLQGILLYNILILFSFDRHIPSIQSF